MRIIKFILNIYFCFIFLIASACSSINKTNLPPKLEPEDQQKNEDASITIASTGAHAVVCIGSNNTIHIGGIEQAAQPNKEINPLQHTTPNNKNTIPPDSIPINIQSTDPEGTVLLGSNNTIYRHTAQQQKTINEKEDQEEAEEEDQEETEEEAENENNENT